LSIDGVRITSLTVPQLRQEINVLNGDQSGLKAALLDKLLVLQAEKQMLQTSDGALISSLSQDDLNTAINTHGGVPTGDLTACQNILTELRRKEVYVIPEQLQQDPPALDGNQTPQLPQAGIQTPEVALQGGGNGQQGVGLVARESACGLSFKLEHWDAGSSTFLVSNPFVSVPSNHLVSKIARNIPELWVPGNIPSVPLEGRSGEMPVGTLQLLLAAGCPGAPDMVSVTLGSVVSLPRLSRLAEQLTAFADDLSQAEHTASSLVSTIHGIISTFPLAESQVSKGDCIVAAVDDSVGPLAARANASSFGSESLCKFLVLGACCNTPFLVASRSQGDGGGAAYRSMEGEFVGPDGLLPAAFAHFATATDSIFEFSKDRFLNDENLPSDIAALVLPVSLNSYLCYKQAILEFQANKRAFYLRYLSTLLKRPSLSALALVLEGGGTGPELGVLLDRLMCAFCSGTSALSLSSLAALNAAVRPFTFVLGAVVHSVDGASSSSSSSSSSSAGAETRVTQVIEMAERDRMLLRGKHMSAGDSSSSTQGASVSGSAVNKVLSSFDAVIRQIASAPNNEEGQRSMVKLALLTHNSTFYRFLREKPSAPETQSFPGVEKIHAASSQLPYVVAFECVKNVPSPGAASVSPPDAVILGFRDVLLPKELLAITNGVLPSFQRLAVIYSALRRVMALRKDFTERTFSQIVEDSLLLRDFISFLVCFFGIFGFNVSELSRIADASDSLTLRLDEGQRREARSRNTLKAMQVSFRNYETTIVVWAAVTDSDSTPSLSPHLDDLVGAQNALGMALLLDTSSFGFNMFQGASSSAGSTRYVAESSGASVSSSVVKSSSTSVSSKRKAGTVPTGVPAAKSVSFVTQGSNYPKPHLLNFSSDGSKFTWSKSTYNAKALQESFDADNQLSGIKFDKKFTTGLLVSTRPELVDAFVHPDVTSAQLQAIHKWRSGHSPSDFR